MTLKELIVKWHGREYRAQSALANTLGVQVASVSHWTSGRYRPGPDRMKAMAKLLGVSNEELLLSLPRNKSNSQPKTDYDTKLKAIMHTAMLVKGHAAGAEPIVKDAMEIIIDLCGGEHA